MTEQGQPEASSFNQRSDNAASLLKQAMDLPPAQVEVDENGRPPAPPPPEGSYVRQAHDEAVAAQARIQQAEQAPSQPTEPIPPSPREQLTNDVSDKAADRIKDLVDKLRDKDQAHQQLQANFQQSAAELAELKQLAGQLRSEREQLRQAQLETLDPEERARILGQIELQEAMQAAEQRILSQLQPKLEKIDRHEVAREYETLASKYPGGFDPTVHPTLIDQFREKNPNCSIELAFRAVASNEELGVGSGRNANPVPPSLAPSHSGVPKSVNLQQVSQPNNGPVDEIAEESAAAYKLMRSKDHNDNKAGIRAIDSLISKRLFGS